MHTDPSRPSVDNVRPEALRSAADARLAALLCLSAWMPPSEDVVVIDASTCEFDVGWVFYYQSAAYMASGDVNDSLAGNAPLFVPRDGGPPQVVGYHRPLAEAMDAYRYGGDANAAPDAAVELLRAGPNAQIVPATLAIRRVTPIGMGAAKSAVEACVAGATPWVATPTVADARTLVEALHRLGFAATVTYGRTAPPRVTKRGF